MLKVRLTADEFADIQARAKVDGTTVSDLVRRRLLNYRHRRNESDRQILLHLARIGGNINQLARWANTYKGQFETIEIIVRLGALQAEIKTLASGPCS
jgi:hypothetical protein